MERTRRAVLAMGAAGLASIAGCLGGGDGGDGNSDGGGGSNDGGGGGGDGDGGNSGPFPELTDVNEVVREEETTLEIPAGEFEDFELEFPEAGALSYQFENTKGFPIDVLMIRDGEFDYFQQGHQVNYNPDNSAQGLAEGSSSARISSGSYHLVVDNSEMANAQPPTPSGEMQEGTDTEAGTDAGTDAGDGADGGDDEETATQAATATESEGGSDDRTAVVEFSFQAGR